MRPPAAPSPPPAATGTELKEEPAVMPLSECARAPMAPAAAGPCGVAVVVVVVMVVMVVMVVVVVATRWS